MNSHPQPAYSRLPYLSAVLFALLLPGLAPGQIAPAPTSRGAAATAAAAAEEAMQLSVFTVSEERDIGTRSSMKTASPC